MKKLISCVLAVLFITVLFSSCGSGASTPPTAGSVNHQDAGTYAAASAAPYAGTVSAAAPPKFEPAGGSASDQAANSESGNAAALPSGSAVTSGSIAPTLSGDKIIYNLNAQIETTKFDDTLKNLQMLLGRYGAFVEGSSINGNSYGNTNYRSADYTIRVPVANFTGMQDSLSTLGNVIYSNTTSQNITTQFIDTQSRLDAYKTEESRLLAMLEKATTVQDMITIESRLSDVRYQIESLTSTLQNWQNQVSFSTVKLHISEVAELSKQTPVQRTYWERMRDGIQTVLSGIGTFFKDLFLVVIVALPVLIILAVIALAIILIIRASRKKKSAKLNQINQNQTNQNSEKKE